MAQLEETNSITGDTHSMLLPTPNSHDLISFSPTPIETFSSATAIDYDRSKTLSENYATSRSWSH
jgi:hypothetical protein